MQVGRQKCVQLKKLTLTSKNNIQTVYTLTSESACYENRSSTLSSQVCSIVPFRFCCKLFKICHGLYLRSSHFLSQENEKKRFQHHHLYEMLTCVLAICSHKKMKKTFSTSSHTKCFVKTVAFENKDFW